MADPITLLLYGEDEPRLKQFLREKLLEFLPDGEGFDSSSYDGGVVPPDEIFGSALTLPFLASYRVVMAENLTLNSQFDELLKDFAGRIAALPDSTRLILIEKNLQPGKTGDSQAETSRKAKRKKALKALVKIVSADPRGEVFSFEVPGDTNSMVAWMQDRARLFGVAIDRDAALSLIERVGEDLVLADSEIEKLSAYVGAGGTITREGVDLLSPYSADASIFALVDSLGERSGAEALKLLFKLIDEGDDPLRIFGMITRQYRLIIQMRESLESGQSVSSAGRAIGISHQFISEKIARQARRYPSLENLDRIYEHLLSVDVQMKTGKIEPVLALERLIAVLNR